MNRIEQIKAEQKKLADELEGEMLKERANVLAKIKEDIKLFGFKTSCSPPQRLSQAPLCFAISLESLDGSVF